MELNLEVVKQRLNAPPSRRLKSCLRSLHKPFTENNSRAVRSGKKVGRGSQYLRRTRLTNCLKELHAIGYEIEDAKKIQHRHIRALMAYWLAIDLSANTIKDRISTIRIFLSWVGKQGMIGPATDYVSEADRHRVQVTTVAEDPKGWLENGVDIEAKLDEVARRNPRVAMVLLIAAVIGLRRREAATLRPHDAMVELASGSVQVTHGTKGGRDRGVVSFDPEFQKSVLELACCVVDRPGVSLVPSGQNLKQFLGTIRNVCNRAGMTRAEHCNPHAMRHSYAVALYERLSGVLAPVKGQGINAPVDGDDSHMKAKLNAARRAVSRNLGHNRARVTSAYIGGLKKSRAG